MDGAHDRPPGRTAENWSRNDRIRAGAVSGPWRSGQRTDTPPAPRSETPVSRAEPAAPHRAVEAPAAPPVRETRPSRPAAPIKKRTGRLAMTAWIAFGILFAAGCVGLAFLFQPAGVPPEAEGDTVAAAAGRDEEAVAIDAPAPAVEAPAVEPAATVAAPAGDVTLAGISNVRLRTGTGLPETARDAVAAALERAGIADVQVEALPFEVGGSRVGYYRAEDRAVAEALAAWIAPVLGRADPLPVRDYHQLLDNAEPGRLDLWIGG